MVTVGLQLPPGPLSLALVQWNLTLRGYVVFVVVKPGAAGGLPVPALTPNALK
jgi:hypothetical protein